MKIIIFGGNGFIGKYLCNEFLKKKIKVTVFDKKIPKKKLTNIKYIKGDISNFSSVHNAIKGHKIIYNLAGISDISDSIKYPFDTVKVNILGTVNTLEASRKLNIKKYIFASSIYVFSSQGGNYRVSKKSSELFIQEYGNRYNLNYVILRFGSVFGIGADLRNGISKILSQAYQTGKLRYSGTHKAVRKFIHIRDAAYLASKVISSKYSKTSVLITGKKNIKLLDLMIYLKKKLGIKKKIVYSNKVTLGHYDINPYSYKEIPSKKINYKTKTSFKKNLDELLIKLKK